MLDRLGGMFRTQAWASEEENSRTNNDFQRKLWQFNIAVSPWLPTSSFMVE